MAPKRSCSPKTGCRSSSACRLPSPAATAFTTSGSAAAPLLDVAPSRVQSLSSRAYPLRSALLLVCLPRTATDGLLKSPENGCHPERAGIPVRAYARTGMRERDLLLPVALLLQLRGTL